MGNRFFHRCTQSFFSIMNFFEGFSGSAARLIAACFSALVSLSALAQTYRHDDLNRLSNALLGNGSVITTAYDAAGNVISVVKANAGQIAIRSTGMDKNGVKLGGGQNDQNWSIVAGPGLSSAVPAVVLNSPGSWGYVLSETANWVWLNSAGSGGLEPYTFEVRFNLPAEWAAHAKLTGLWAVDNIGEIFINGKKANGSGVELPHLIVDNYLILHEFSIESGFAAGENRLQFVVRDLGNPGGLLVDRLSVNYQSAR